MGPLIGLKGNLMTFDRRTQHFLPSFMFGTVLVFDIGIWAAGQHTKK